MIHTAYRHGQYAILWGENSDIDHDDFEEVMIEEVLDPLTNIAVRFVNSETIITVPASQLSPLDNR